MIATEPPCVLLVLELDASGLAALVATEIGFGATLGFLLGYGLKKIAAFILKIMAVMAAVLILILTWLASVGMISINFSQFSTIFGSALFGATTGLVKELPVVTGILPIGGSFGLGFYFGAKKG